MKSGIHILMMMSMLSCHAIAGDIGIQWSPGSNRIENAVYRVYAGSHPRGTNGYDLGYATVSNRTSVIVTNLDVFREMYFAVTMVKDGKEGDFSNELFWDPRKCLGWDRTTCVNSPMRTRTYRSLTR